MIHNVILYYVSSDDLETSWSHKIEFGGHFNSKLDRLGQLPY